MKIAGIDPKSLSNEVLLVLPRGDPHVLASDIELNAQGLANWLDARG